MMSCKTIHHVFLNKNYTVLNFLTGIYSSVRVLLSNLRFSSMTEVIMWNGAGSVWPSTPCPGVRLSQAVSGAPPGDAEESCAAAAATSTIRVSLCIFDFFFAERQ